MSYFVFTDLDDKPCATFLIEDWFEGPIADYPKRRAANLLFRIAVHEVESWIMADRESFAKFLGISVHKIPLQTDDSRSQEVSHRLGAIEPEKRPSR